MIIKLSCGEKFVKIRKVVEGGRRKRKYIGSKMEGRGGRMGGKEDEEVG